MPRTLESLQAEVLKLSPLERAQLLDCLIASLDKDAEIEAEWDNLALKRESEMASGSVQGVPLEDVVSRLESRFAG